jgi:hypothetical protein
MDSKLRVFVASSSEQIRVAERVEQALKSPLLDVHVWREDVFTFSNTYIESLEEELERADFSVVIMTGDDAGTVRENTVNLPRDNVVFELGLFLGRLGRGRTFFLVDRASGTKIASDLSGVKPVEFQGHASGKGPAAPTLNQQVEGLRALMEAQGPRYKPSRDDRRKQAALWRFSTRVAGQWWERMRKGEDDMSALSYVTVTVDGATNSPILRGDAYDLDGGQLAEWHSTLCGIVLGDRPVIYYRWEGEHDENRGQTYGGGGRVLFDNLELVSASGYFYDTNFALLEIEATTRIKHCAFYRARADDVETMRTPSSEKAGALVKRKLDELDGR